MDRMSKLPLGIIETILCFLPIQEAARTSILSREWRYHWTTIPKLAFDEDTFQVSSDEAEPSVLEQTFNFPSQRKNMTNRCKFFYAIYQVLLMHQGPIREFTLCMEIDGSCVEIDHIILHLLRKNTLKILKLDLNGSYMLPLSFFSLHQLTELYLNGCVFQHQPESIGFGSLTTLNFQEIFTDEQALVCLLSSCPLLKRLTISTDSGTIDVNGDSTLADLMECLQGIENLSFWFFIFLISEDDLEDEEYMGSSALEDCSDISLEQLNELEILHFSNEENGLVFVKLILAKSPGLKKVQILLWDRLTKKEKLKTSKILLSYPRASPVVKIIVS